MTVKLMTRRPYVRCILFRNNFNNAALPLPDQLAVSEFLSSGARGTPADALMTGGSPIGELISCC